MPRASDDIGNLRRCRDCDQWKNIEEFHKSPRRPSGRGSYCQPCFNERSKASYAKRVQRREGREVNKARVVPEGFKYCPDCDQDRPLAEFPKNRADSTGLGSYCKPCHNKRGRDSKISNHGGTRQYHLKRRYGITEEEVRGILLAQRGGCGICGAPDPEQVDHDHVTGEVRGILCFKPIVRTRRCRPSAATPRLLTIGCNGGLGQFKDNIATMRNAIDYLKETS